MAKILCTTCGKTHDELETGIAYLRPMEYFGVPEEERPKRIKMDDDLCIIDDKLYFIRSVLELPVKDGKEPFGWGVWPQVSQKDFNKYIKLWSAKGVEKEPPIEATLSGGVRGYPYIDLLPVTLHLRSGGKRPLVKVISADYPLGVDQRQGITMEKVHEFFKR